MERVTYSIKGALAVCGATISLLLCLLGSAPPAAQATESHFCGTTLVGLATCYGEPRTFNAVFGSGLDHAVCVGSSQGGNVTCTSGPNEGTYDALGGWVYANPWIRNQGFSSNRVGGVAFTP